MKEIFGLGRTRHGDKGAISGLHLNDYTMCIHTHVGGGVEDDGNFSRRSI